MKINVKNLHHKQLNKKEVDAVAAAVASDQKQAVRILKYVLKGTLK